MKKSIAVLQWSLDIECPHCKCEFDLSDGDQNDEGQISIQIFNNKWDDLNGRSIYCPKCDKRFQISEVEY